MFLVDIQLDEAELSRVRRSSRHRSRQVPYFCSKTSYVIKFKELAVCWTLWNLLKTVITFDNNKNLYFLADLKHLSSNLKQLNFCGLQPSMKVAYPDTAEIHECLGGCRFPLSRRMNTTNHSILLKKVCFVSFQTICKFWSKILWNSWF